MRSVPDDDKANAFDSLLSALPSKAALRDADIQMLRHAFYEEGVIERRQAAAIFHANRVMQTDHNGWNTFYLEALTDVFLTPGHEGYVVDAGAESMLLTWLGDGVAIPNPGERQLTLRLLMRAANEPDALEQRVLQAVSENLLHESQCWIGGGNRSPGAIGATDIQLIRRLVYRSGNAQGRAIRKAVIPFLLRLDRQAASFADPDEWRQFLTACLAQQFCQGLPADLDPLQLSRRSFSAEMRALLNVDRTPEDATSLMAHILSEARHMIATGCQELVAPEPDATLRSAQQRRTDSSPCV